MSPLSINAFADAFNFSSLTLSPQQFQLFHPIGGVSASRSPHFMVKFLLDSPILFLTTNTILYSALFFNVPVITPFVLFTDKPAGKFSTLYRNGFFPVAGILKRKGAPGLTPNTFAPFILGCSVGLGVSI